MKKLIILSYVFLAIAWPSMSQSEQLLDGTSLDYQYENGGAVHAEFVDGQYKYTWTAGPLKGVEGQEQYESIKIGDKLYMINFKVSATSTFVTVVFNFGQNEIYTSAIFNPGTEEEQIFMDSGIIKQLKLKEK